MVLPRRNVVAITVSFTGDDDLDSFQVALVSMCKQKVYCGMLSPICLHLSLASKQLHAYLVTYYVYIHMQCSTVCGSVQQGGYF